MARRHVRDPKTNDLIILNEQETAIYEERLRIAEERARKRKRIGCLLKVLGVLFLLFLIAICSGKDDDKKTSSKTKSNDEVVNSEVVNSEEGTANMNKLMEEQSITSEQKIDDANNSREEKPVIEEKNVEENSTYEENAQENYVDEKTLKKLQKEERKRQKQLEKEAKRKAKEEAKEAKRRAKEEAKRMAENDD